MMSPLDQQLEKIERLDHLLSDKIKSTGSAEYRRLREKLHDKRQALLSEEPAVQVALAESYWRPLNAIEQPHSRSLARLQDVFETEEQKILADLMRVLEEEVLPGIERQEDKIKKAAVAAIMAFLFLRKNKISQRIGTTQSVAYEQGKTAAASELDVEKTATPRLDMSLATQERQAVAQAMADDINGAVRNTILTGIAKGVAAVSIVAAAKRTARERYERMAKNISGTVVGENVNRGRRAVFTKNQDKIVGYIRSEILDRRTCNMCISLDGRFVFPDDPISKADIIHGNCRGLWIPVRDESKIPKNTGIPKSIVDNLNTVGGVPVVNQFTQLKKPIKK